MTKAWAPTVIRSIYRALPDLELNDFQIFLTISKNGAEEDFHVHSSGFHIGVLSAGSMPKRMQR